MNREGATCMQPGFLATPTPPVKTHGDQCAPTGTNCVRVSCNRRRVESRTRDLFAKLARTTTYRHLSPRLVEEAATACFLAAVAELGGAPAPSDSLASARAELACARQVVRGGVAFRARVLDGGCVNLSFADAGGGR